MAINAIQTWLSSGKSFAAGVELYKKHAKATPLLSLFANENSYSRQKLEESLKAILEATPKPKAKKNTKKLPEYKSYTLPHSKKGIIDINKLDDEHMELFYELGRLRHKRRALHAELRLRVGFESSKKELEDIAFKIAGKPKGLTARINTLHEKLLYFVEHSKSKPEGKPIKPLEGMSEAQLVREKANSTSNRSKAKKRGNEKLFKFYHERIQQITKILEDGKAESN